MSSLIDNAHSLIPIALFAFLPTHIRAEVAFQNFVDLNDADYVWYGIGEGGNDAPAQRFAADAGGMVGSISMILSPDVLTDVPLIVDVRTVNNDLPGAILGSVTGKPLLPSFHNFITIDFTSSSVTLDAGQDYFVVFRTSHGNGNGYYPFYYVQTVKQSQASAGYQAIYSPTGGVGGSWYDAGPLYPQEIGLIVTVVPEPATALLFACGYLSVLCFRRRTR